MLSIETGPDDLDALTAAPQHHTVLFENEFIRVLDIHVSPGDRVPLHTHRWPGTLHLLQWSHCVRRDAAGTVLMDSQTSAPPAVGSISWAPALGPHTLENVGVCELHLVGVEYKRPDALPLVPKPNPLK